MEWKRDWSDLVEKKDRAARRARKEYDKAYKAFKEGNEAHAAFYLGAMAHYIGDVSQYGARAPSKHSLNNNSFRGQA